jgi:hypothetical protein
MVELNNEASRVRLRAEDAIAHLKNVGFGSKADER